jgi:hypothetical protein
VRTDGRVKADVKRASQIIYAPDGYMCVVNTRIARDKVSETVAHMDLDATTPDERAAATPRCATLRLPATT